MSLNFENLPSKDSLSLAQSNSAGLNSWSDDGTDVDIKDFFY